MLFKNIIMDILSAYGPSGREETVSDVIKTYVAPLADEVYTDKLGNLIAHKKGAGKKVMLSAHMDQIGLIVTDIDDKGFLRISNVGGVNAPLTVGRPVKFDNGTKGVTYYETKDKKLGDAALKDMFIDVGAKTRAQAEMLVNIGDVAVYDTPFVEMGRRLSSGAMDNRICCAIIVEAMKELSTDHDVYAVFTTQEEVGLRGAMPAAYALEPDFNLNLDVTLCGDTPECGRMSVSLGKGPTVKLMDSSVIVPMSVRKFMQGVAERNGIPYQNEVLYGGGTDTAAAQRSRAGVLAGCISIPCRYVHSPVETVDMDDVENAVKFVRAILAEKELPTV